MLIGTLLRHVMRVVERVGRHWVFFQKSCRDYFHVGHCAFSFDHCGRPVVPIISLAQVHPDAGSNGLCGLGVAALKFLLSVVAHGLEILVLQSQSFRFPHLLPFTCGGGYGPN